MALRRGRRFALGQSLVLGLGLTLGGLCAAGSAIAADAPAPLAHDFSTYVPTAKATRIETAEAPIIDGDLSDAAWAKAQVIDEFYQLDPPTGAPGTERTELRIIYDENNLYLGIYCFDKEPDKIIGTIQTRDGMLGVDDKIGIYLDPLNTRRNSYYFEVNSMGARQDGLLLNNQDMVKEWNTIWTAKVKRVADGFTIEIAFPFRDFSYDPNKMDWVFDFTRNIKRKAERLRWSAISAATGFADITRSGTLTGFTGLTSGLGLDLQLYAKAVYKRDWRTNPDTEAVLGSFSGNAFYKFTPSLIGTLTVNPDFSDSPLDERQINTTRFVLFQPETRNFFLQDTARFEFGGRGFASNSNNYPYGSDNGRPFFSRNIGLANGNPVNITGGGKLSGEYDSISIGALSVVTNGTGITKDRQVLSVARVTAPVFTASKVGFVVTNGDPTGLSRNTVAGTDFQYRDSNFLPGQILQWDSYYERSFSNTKGDDSTFGTMFSYPNEPWGLEGHFKQIGANYYPALGFANRTGVRIYDGRAIYRDRTLGWRWFDVAGSYNITTGLDNKLQSRELGFWTGIQDQATDQFYVKVFSEFEDVAKVFNLPGSVPVPVGHYSWTNVDLNFQTSNARWWSIKGDVFCCSFYNGDYVKADLQFDFRPSIYFQMSPRYTLTYIKLPTGKVTVHLIQTDLTVNFTPDMQLLTQIQYDNISSNVGVSMRYRWEYEAGQEIFASFGQSALVPGEDITLQTSQFTVRLGHTFQF